jgi:hypothetical protein
LCVEFDVARMQNKILPKLPAPHKGEAGLLERCYEYSFPLYFFKKKWIFKKWGGGAWTGLSWLMIGTGGGLLRMR